MKSPVHVDILVISHSILALHSRVYETIDLINKPAAL